MPQAGLRRGVGPVTQRNESEPSDSLLEHPHETFRLLVERLLGLGFPVRLRGRESAMARMASDSALRTAFAVSDRRSAYQRARGAAASLVSSIVAIDSIFLSPDWRRNSTASRRSPDRKSTRLN